MTRLEDLLPIYFVILVPPESMWALLMLGLISIYLKAKSPG